MSFMKIAWAAVVLSASAQAFCGGICPPGSVETPTAQGPRCLIPKTVNTQKPGEASKGIKIGAPAPMRASRGYISDEMPMTVVKGKTPAQVKAEASSAAPVDKQASDPSRPAQE